MEHEGEQYKALSQAGADLNCKLQAYPGVLELIYDIPEQYLTDLMSDPESTRFQDLILEIFAALDMLSDEGFMEEDECKTRKLETTRLAVWLGKKMTEFSVRRR